MRSMNAGKLVRLTGPKLVFALFLAIGANACSDAATAPTNQPATKKKPTSGKPNSDGGTDDVGDLFGGNPSGDTCVKDPANYDIPDNKCDDDGDGKVDNGVSCDDGLVTTGDAYAFAKALGICKKSNGNDWGVVSAQFTNGYNAPNKGLNNFDAQHGILPKFGSVLKPREGTRLAVLSSGFAGENNTDNGPNFRGGKLGMQSTGMFDTSDAPPGFPKPTTGCEVSKTVQDVINARLTIKVPKNAKGMAFDFNFFSSEWPDYVCSMYNDSFVAILKSQAFNKGVEGNMSFDGNGNPVSVNNGFFDRCTPGITLGCKSTLGGSAAGLGKSKCTGGESELEGTGFFVRDRYCDNTLSTGGGATGWLSSKAPVTPGETITLSFMIWDTGDVNYDSSVLLDNFRWEPGEVKETSTTRPPR
jgi:hypothetical protein